MRIVCISDTHSRHQKMPPIPEGDVLIHAGDCTGAGHIFEVKDFAKWFRSHPHKRKIAIAGNHDYCFQKKHPVSTWAREAFAGEGIIYLEDEEVIIDGVRFYGSPWTPVFRNMAFNAGEEERFRIRAQIPEDTDVLITHGPAWRIFDYVPDDREHVGCFPLAQRIDQLKLKAHICGHIHESYGYAIRESDGLKFVNACTCDRSYRPVNPPIIIDI
jgi:Icc-related predicted phosphoesterase